MSRRFKVAGLDSLNAKLKIMPKVVEEQIKRAMEDAAQDIVDLAENLAPLGEGPDGGALRASIGWTWGDIPKGAIKLGNVRASKDARSNLVITVYAGNDEAFYARWVEFGTNAHSTSSGALLKSGRKQEGRMHPGAKAQPFFYPAYRANKKAARRKVSTATRRALKQVAKG